MYEPLKKKKFPRELSLGDLWCGFEKNLWVLIEKKETRDFLGLYIWELTWYGKDKDQNAKVFSKIWTQDSRFEILSSKESDLNE